MVGVLGAFLVSADSKDPDDPAYWEAMIRAFQSMFGDNATCTAIEDCEECMAEKCGTLLLKDIASFIATADNPLATEIYADYYQVISSGFACGIDADKANKFKSLFDASVTSGVIDIQNYQSLLINDCGVLHHLAISSAFIAAYLLT